MLNTCLLVTPALAAANNGNWQTARRWQHYAGKQVKIRLALNDDGIESPDCAIALHALRSADSIRSLKQRGIPTALVLTGTDLYRDIQSHTKAQDSLELADFLVVLNEQGIQELPQRYRSKARCIFQSAPQRVRLPVRRRTDDFAFVGHLRHEKDPLTAARALAHLDNKRLRLRVVGQAHSSQDGTAQEMQSIALVEPRMELLGGLPHSQARAIIAQSHALIVSSQMEGGANVLIEAITSGVPVLASQVPGNVGMLGPLYPGYFSLGDDKALAQLMRRVLVDKLFLEALNQACAARRILFAPQTEAAAVLQLLEDLLTLPRSV
jgi:putative glycosyltransferase (TIGR04348 family)